MNTGIIGFGLMGKQRAEDVNKLPYLKLKSVFDIDFNIVKPFEKVYGFNTANSKEEIINDKEIELVILSVPHFLIEKLAIQILKSKKHLLCEKPLGRTVNEASSILSHINDSLIEPGFNYRYYDGILKVKELITKNKVGKIHSVRCVLGHGGRPGMEKEWKLDKKLCGGGALLDPGIHVIDLTRFLFGEIQKGFLVQQNAFWKTNVEDNVMLFLETQETELTINISITEWESLFRLEIFGEDGAIYFSGRSNNYGSQKIRFVKRWFWDQNSQDEIWEFSNNENSFLNELTDFCNVIEGGESDKLATPQDGYRAIEIIENLYNSPNRFISL